MIWKNYLNLACGCTEAFCDKLMIEGEKKMLMLKMIGFVKDIFPVFVGWFIRGHEDSQVLLIRKRDELSTGKFGMFEGDIKGLSPAD